MKDFKEAAKAYVRGPISWIDDSYAAHEDTFLAGASHGYQVGKAEGDRLSKLETLIAGHMEAMRPLLDEWHSLKGVKP